MKKEWNYSQKLTVLFLFVYFLLYTNSTQFISTFLLEPIWRKVIPQFALLIGHETPITIFTNGSGDTTYNYFQVLFFLILAVVLSLAISILNKEQRNYIGLKRWLVILIRYYLALQLITYGVSKLLYLQFQFPPEFRLEQTLGDFSPMGLLWTFMGYSKGYTMFTGALEFIGGLFLFSRKTLTLGALISFGVMANVMMLNYCYDVPVKLLSTHMVMMALYLISTDMNRVIKYFFKNESVGPKELIDVLPTKFIKAKNIIKWVAIIAFISISFYKTNQMGKLYSPKSPKQMFNGKYSIEVEDRIPIDSLHQHQNSSLIGKWNTFLPSQTKGFITIKTNEDKKLIYNFEPDSTSKTVKLKLDHESIYQELNYSKLGDENFHMYGIYKSDSVKILMRKMKRTLVDRKFNWINEYPYNK